MRCVLCWTALALVLVAPAAGRRAAAGAPPSAPTFTQDVAPIIFAQCAACHRPGSVGPFPLLSYADVKKRARQLVRSVESRQMPPWKPEPGFGEFRDERRLTKEQLATLKAWADAGAPEGDPRRLPPVPQFPEGWQLGKPDLVVKMPRPYKIPAEGQDPYVHVVFPLDLQHDTYLRGIEVRPGNPRVAHHAIGLLDGSGQARKIARQEGDGVTYDRFGGPGFLPGGFTPGFVPGQLPRFFEPGTAITLKKGTDFVLQMHYHPVGKEEYDQTEVGFYFSRTPPKRKLSALMLGSEDIDIPAGLADYAVADEVKLPCAFEVTGIWAHMHMIGKTVEAWAELPEGRRINLLQIKDWDFNWQDFYRYRQPIQLPKDTVVKAVWSFDNSAKHPRNPYQPPRRIKHGPNSTDEMGGLVLDGIVADWPEELAMAGVNIGHYLEVASKTKGKRIR